jgi:AraC family transcriptional regulator of adaptative response / DNA-3-methyladenine glycosylase II
LAAAALLGPRIAGRVAATFGAPVNGDFGLERLFPDARELTNAPLERAGVGTARAGALRSLARRVSMGAPASPESLMLPGIDEWSAEYIAMRAMGEPDRFPSLDPALRRNAEEWRPWRAYAFMLLQQQDVREVAGKPWRNGNAESGDGRFAPGSVLGSS